jgi:hypothetical protein
MALIDSAESELDEEPLERSSGDENDRLKNGPPFDGVCNAGHQAVRR